MDQKTLIFLHIPKTAGRSLQDIILRQYRDGTTITDVHKRRSEIKAWPDSAKRTIKYMQGHVAYGIHEILPQRTAYITMMRDPVDRVISHYYFIKRSPEHPLNRVIMERNFGLEDYARFEGSKELQNDQARLIAGVGKDELVAPAEVLEKAIRNVETNFLMIGLVERFDETLVYLKRKLGWRNIFYGVRNQTINRPSKDEIPNRTQQEIAKRNRTDIELYAYAQEALANKIVDEGPDFVREVNRFRAVNRPYAKLFYAGRRLKNGIYAYLHEK